MQTVLFLTAVYLSLSRMGDIVNDFRTRPLGLKPLTARSGPSLVDHLKIPWTYCMSPSLVPKPNDWTNHIGILNNIVN